MRKIIEISTLEPFKIFCTFDNNEQRLLDLTETLNTNDKYAKKVLDHSVFSKVKIGVFGELYWENMAEIKDYDGNIVPCAYDISPEFAYVNSISQGKLKTH